MAAKKTIEFEPYAYTVTRNGVSADHVISALQKCIRRADEQAALRFAYELYVTSEFHEQKMWTRLLVIAVEDIGFGDPYAHSVVQNLYASHTALPYGCGDRALFFMFAIRYLCKCKKERSTNDMLCLIERESKKGELPEIPPCAIDMHTKLGQERGMDIFDFLDDGRKVIPEWEGYDDTYVKKFYEICVAEREAAEKEDK